MKRKEIRAEAGGNAMDSDGWDESIMRQNGR